MTVQEGMMFSCPPQLNLLIGTKLQHIVVNGNSIPGGPGSPNETDKKRPRRPYNSKTIKVELSYAAKMAKSLTEQRGVYQHFRLMLATILRHTKHRYICHTFKWMRRQHQVLVERDCCSPKKGNFRYSRVYEESTRTS